MRRSAASDFSIARAIEPAGLAQIFAQPGRLLFLVQNAIVAAPQRLGHDQPNAVGADVDRRQARRQLGREEKLLFFHRICRGQRARPPDLAER